MKKALGKKFLRKHDDDRANSSKSDGANLALGSSEYRERVRDLQNIDEKTQDDLKVKARAEIKMEEPKPYCVEHEQRREALANEPEKMSVERDKQDNMRLSTGERGVSHQILKSAQAQNVADIASKEAAKTETQEDDKFVHRRLPKMIEKDVYDEGKSLDDFYPGSSVLDKYM